MARPSGVDTKFAFRMALPIATYPWGTAIQVGARDQILHRPLGFKKSRPFEVDNSLGTGGFATTGDLGAITASGDWQGYLRYMGLDALIAAVMGASTAPTYTSPVACDGTGAGSTTTLLKTGASWTPDALIGTYWTCDADATNPTNVGQTRRITDNTADTLTWVGPLPFATSSATQGNLSAGIAERTYTLADTLEGIYGTGCIWNGMSMEELTSCKVAGMTIKGGTGKPVEVTFDLLANDKSLSSAVNTATTTWTVPESANRVMTNHLVSRMNTAAGDALDSADAIRFASWELAIKRPLKGVYGVGSTDNQVDEPSNDGQVEVTFKGTLPRFETAAHLTAWEAGTDMKMDMTFTGALLGGTTYRTIFIELPKLRYTLAEAPIKDGILEHQLEFSCMQPSAAPTGMTATKPVQIKVVNNFCGNPLQAGN
jgi:hypothetical protein